MKQLKRALDIAREFKGELTPGSAAKIAIEYAEQFINPTPPVSVDDFLAKKPNETPDNDLPW